MNLVWVKDLTGFRADPDTQPVIVDGVPQAPVLIRLINRKRTPIVYGDEYGSNPNESMSWLTDLSDGISDAIAANPDIVTSFTYAQALGEFRQVIDEDGNPVFEDATVETMVEYQETTGYHDEPVMTLVKQVRPGWTVTQVQNRNDDPDDDIPDGQYAEGFTDVWTYDGDEAVETDEGTTYPSRYHYVEVDTGEVRSVPEYETKTRIETETARVPAMHWIEPDPEAKAVYDRIYPRTPYKTKNEDGSVLVVTPPHLFGFIDGHQGGLSK